METVQLKHCPICTEDLPVSEFGICRARKDGRNLYCMSCIREKVTASRRALKEYKAARKKYAAPVEAIDLDAPVSDLPLHCLFKLSPVDRVRNAIRNGRHTQAEIRSETKLGKDEIGDAIANLLLWSKEIRTQVIDGTRMYFENKPVELPEINYPASASLVEIARKTCGPVIKGERRIQRVA